MAHNNAAATRAAVVHPGDPPRGVIANHVFVLVLEKVVEDAEEFVVGAGSALWRPSRVNSPTGDGEELRVPGACKAGHGGVIRWRQ